MTGQKYIISAACDESVHQVSFGIRCNIFFFRDKDRFDSLSLAMVVEDDA